MNRGLARGVAAAILVSLLLAGFASWIALRGWDERAPALARVPTAAASSSEPVVEPVDVTPGLRGRILDPEGNAVAGATVRLLTASTPYRVLRLATSDGVGAFSFAHATDGRVIVEADRDPAGFVSSAVLEVTAGEGRDVTLVLSAMSGVRGTVLDPQGHPVAGAVLSIDGMPWTVPSATSNGAGMFHLIVVPDEAASLVAEASGYDATRIPLTHREPGVELQLTVRLPVASDAGAGEGEPGSIAGVVVDEQGAAVGAFTLAVQSHDSPAGRSDLEGPRKFEDAHGAFLLDRLAPGRYVLAASAPGKPPKRSEPIEVQRGSALRDVRIVLAAGGSVTGRVYDKQRAPVAAAEVVFGSANGSTPSVTARTDDLGRFRLDEAPVGALTLRVQKAGFRTRTVSGLQVRDGSTLNKDVVLAPGD